MAISIDAAEETIEKDLKGLQATKEALAGKLRQLEQRVEDNIVGTKQVAWSVIDHVKDTAGDLLGSAMGQVHRPFHASRKSWTTVGISVAAGLVGSWMKRRMRSGTNGAKFIPPSLWGDITQEFGKEGERLRMAALMTGRSFIHDLAGIAVRSLINAFDRRAVHAGQKTNR
jgi:hypothetical protein